MGSRRNKIQWRKCRHTVCRVSSLKIEQEKPLTKEGRGARRDVGEKNEPTKYLRWNGTICVNRSRVLAGPICPLFMPVVENDTATEHDYLDEDEKLNLVQLTSRRHILVFYWLVVLLAVPFWWKATSIERQSVPEERVKEQTGRPVRIG